MLNSKALAGTSTFTKTEWMINCMLFTKVQISEREPPSAISVKNEAGSEICDAHYTTVDNR